MYCLKCGANNPDGGTFCQACGVPLAAVPAPAPTLPYRRTSGLAVASLVLGIAGFFSFGLTSILAIIFGGIALSQISKDSTLDGKGMAVAGLVMGIVVAAVGVFILLFFFTFSAAAFSL
jgi:hypothetical protein